MDPEGPELGMSELHEAQRNARTFRTLVENSRDMFLTASPEGGILFANRALRDRAGERSRVGSPVWDLFGPASAEAVSEQGLHAVGDGTRRWSADLELLCADGRALEVESTWFPLDDASPAPQVGAVLHGRDRTARALGRLQEVTDAALGSLGLEDLLDALPVRLANALGVDVVRILLVTEAADMLEVRGSYGLDLAELQADVIPLDGPVAGAVARNRSAVVIDLDRTEPHTPELRQRVRTLAGVPLLHDERLVGVLDVGSAARRDFSRDDMDLLHHAAGRVAAALERAISFRRQREIAETLQASLLPAELPSIAGLDVAARYWAAGEGAEVGGDFYDVFALGDPSSWAFAIGDVCGKGVSAAAVTGVVRSTLRVAARHQRSPRTVLSWLNEALRELGVETRDTYCSTFYARIDASPDGFEICAASAGHPYPVLVRADGSTELFGKPGSLLGIFADVDLSEVQTTIGPGDTLVLYTDGVTDVPPPADIDDDLLISLVVDAVTADRHRDAASIADRFGEAVARRRPMNERADDVAIVVLRAGGLPGAAPLDPEVAEYAVAEPVVRVQERACKPERSA